MYQRSNVLIQCNVATCNDVVRQNQLYTGAYIRVYIFFSTLYSNVIALNLSMGAEKNREETVELTTLTYN